MNDLSKLIEAFPQEELNVFKEGKEVWVGVEAQALRNRLNSVFGVGGWTTEYSELRKLDTVVTIGCSLILSTGVNNHETGMIYGSAVVDPAHPEMAIKAAQTNSFVRCCASIGMDASMEQKESIKKLLLGKSNGSKVVSGGDAVAEAREHLRKLNPDKLSMHEKDTQDQPEEKAEEKVEQKSAEETAKVFEPVQSDMSDTEKQTYKEFQDEYGDLAKDAFEKFNLKFASLILSKKFKGGDIRSIMKGAGFPAEEWNKRTGRFTLQFAFKMYCEHCGENERDAEMKVAEYDSRIEEGDASAPKQPEADAPKEESSAPDPEADAPKEESSAPDPEADAPKEEAVAIPRNEHEYDDMEAVDIYEKFEAVDVDEDNYDQKMTEEFRAVFSTFKEAMYYLPKDFDITPHVVD